MELYTKRLLLRKYILSDLKGYMALKSNPLIYKFSTNIPLENENLVLEDLKKIINGYEANDFLFHALVLKENEQETYIGEAGLISYHERNKRVVIGYNLLPEYWNKGYATEITKALVQYSFDLVDVERVEALVVSDNIGSRRVLEKAGLQLEGVLRHFTYINDRYHDVCFYGIIRSFYQVS